MRAFGKITSFEDRHPMTNFLRFLSPTMVPSNANQLKNQYFHEARVPRTQSPIKSSTFWHCCIGTSFSTEPHRRCFVFKTQQSIIYLSVCMSSICPSHHPSLHLPVCTAFLSLANWLTLSSRNSIQLWVARYLAPHPMTHLYKGAKAWPFCFESVLSLPTLLPQALCTGLKLENDFELLVPPPPHTEFWKWRCAAIRAS